MLCVSFSSVIRHHLSTQYMDAAHGPADSHPEFINPVACNCIIVTGNGIVPDGHSEKIPWAGQSSISQDCYGRRRSYVPAEVMFQKILTWINVVRYKGPFARCGCGCDFFAATNGLHWIQCDCSHCCTCSNGASSKWVRNPFCAAVAAASWRKSRKWNVKITQFSQFLDILK